MPPKVAAGLLFGLVLAIGVISLLSWLVIFRVKSMGGTIIPYEARRPVPWGPIGLCLAGLLLVLQVSSMVSSQAVEEPTQQQTAMAVLQWAAIEIFLSAGLFVVLIAAYRATWSDLGLPKSMRGWAADATLGIIAALAALAPVYLTLAALVKAFGERPQNPLLEELFQDPSSQMFLAAAIAAVVAAPIFEEITYRLLIQGWLEKILIAGAAEEETGGESEADKTTNKTRWTPIVISSVLFALAHFGFDYGYSPAPLFLLALVLGYIYQKTHRIVPCIVAHMTFNGTSLVMMWLQIEAGKVQPNL